MNWQHWFWLFLVQAAWTGSYAGMKYAVAEMPVGVVVFLRYGFASLGLLIGSLFTGLPRLERKDLLLVIALGALDFALAPTLQVTSLLYTQAIDVSILIALEPMMTVFVAAMVLGERPTRQTIFALLAGTLGMLILSGVGFQDESEVGQRRLYGNLLFVSSLLCEVAVTVAGRRLARRYPPSQAVTAMKVAGFLTATLVYSKTIHAMDFATISTRGWSAIGFLALFPSIFAYIVWYRVIKVVPVSQAALSLFIQPVVGTALGYWMLGEHIGWHTAIGALLVCSSLAWWQVREYRQRVPESAREV
jgi:drug/metabolite transporter (DMT)-like permease